MGLSQCVTKKEAVRLLGVTMRQVARYLASGELTIDRMEKNRAMINIVDVYNLREKRTKRKRG